MDSCALFSGVIGALCKLFKLTVVSSLYSNELSALYVISGYCIGNVIFRTTNIIFHAGVASTLAIMTESPKCIYGIFPKLFEELSNEFPSELAHIYQKLHSNCPPSYYESSHQHENGWSVNSQVKPRNRNDRWALALFVIFFVIYCYCAGIPLEIFLIIGHAINRQSYTPFGGYVLYFSISLLFPIFLFITFRW